MVYASALNRCAPSRLSNTRPQAALAGQLFRWRRNAGLRTRGQGGPARPQAARNAAAFPTRTTSSAATPTVTSAEANLLTRRCRGSALACLFRFPAGAREPRPSRAAPFNPAAHSRRRPRRRRWACPIPRTYAVNTPGKVKGRAGGRVPSGSTASRNGRRGRLRQFERSDLKVATRANDRLAGLPEVNGTAGIQYEIEAEQLGGSITPRLDWFYTGDIAMSAPPAGSVQPAGLLTVQRPGDLCEPRARPDPRAGVTNLFDEALLSQLLRLSGHGFPNSTASPARRASRHVELSKRF